MIINSPDLIVNSELVSNHYKQTLMKVINEHFRIQSNEQRPRH